MAANGLAEQDRMYAPMTPPEKFTTPGDSYSNAFDIYQAGLTIYRMCIGNNEFYDQVHAYGEAMSFDIDQFKFDVVDGKFPKKDVFPEHIPQKLIDVVKKSLSVNPRQRYISAIDIVNDIADIDGELLDWCYTKNSDGTRSWSKNLENKSIFLEIDSTGSSMAKKGNNSGNLRKINEYCLESIGKQKIKNRTGL